MSIKKENITCWIVTEGMAGTENQCLGVAEALNVKYEIKRTNLKEPWKSFSPILGFEQSWSFDQPLVPPWPDLLLASGRKSIAASRYIKKSSGGATFTVQIQDPRVSSSYFDLVAVPKHDPARGNNVIVTTGAPNRITGQVLLNAKDKFKEFEKLPQPRVAVLIGGDSKAYKLTAAVMHKLADQLKVLDAGLMITTSRRTGTNNQAILTSALEGTDSYIWDGSGDNPYFSILARADYILVTGDSVSMLCDAGTTGKPVYMIPLEGRATRIGKLHQNLKDSGIIRKFDGKLEHWEYEPLADAKKIAEEIEKRLSII